MKIITLNGTDYKLVSVNSLSESVTLALDTLSTWSSSTKGFGYYGCVGKYGIVSFSTLPFSLTTASTNVMSYSTDGLSWSTKSLPLTKRWSGVAYAHGYYVACSYDNDGIFASARGNNSFSWSTFAVTSNAGQYVGMASNGELILANTSNKIYHSQFINNAVTFSTISSQPYTSMSAVKSTNGYFFAFSESSATNCKYSTDGTTWKQQNLSEQKVWIDVSYNPIVGTYLFISSAGDTCQTSSLSVTAVKTAKVPTTGSIKSLTCIGERYYAVDGTYNKHYTISNPSDSWKSESITTGGITGVNILSYGNRICNIGTTQVRSAPIASYSWKSLDSVATTNMENAMKTMLAK